MRSGTVRGVQGLWRVALAPVCALALVGASTAAANPTIVNASFEDGPVTTSWARVQIAGPSIPGWVVVEDNLDHIGTLWAPADGARSLELNGNRAGAIAQTIQTDPGLEYVLTFALSGNFGGPSPKSLEVSAGSVSRVIEVDTTQNSGLSMNWRDETLAFVGEGAQTTITFRSLTPGFHGAAIDDVRLVVIPAPPGALALVGGVGLAM
ncbi:MAG: DUF642 domain-containing protein, partial [Phycisphaerales bacterium]|nr:DUF642 domain-containing protein [Phycisphaerales bacterium]